MSCREYDCIIIGTGPAGLFCAAHLSSTRVLILEKMPLPGRKLLLSGSGQCNITHVGDVKNFINHYGVHGPFLRPALMAYPNTSLLNDSGNVFPESLSADDILDVLLDSCHQAETEILCDTPAENISVDRGIYVVRTKKNIYYAKHLVLATGGMAYPQTGSTGDGLTFAKNLGNSIEKPRPALTPVYIQDHRLTALSGISIPGVRVSIWRSGRQKFVCCGVLLITRFGYSGQVILNASRWMRDGDLLKIAFSSLNAEELDVLIRNFSSSFGAKRVQNLLNCLGCPNRVIKQ
ncbi:MAG TPA: aminoacetone oxidase family FAD-binding enzyme, partial [Methanocorpusculum sp.]|nr:aminoacetone oxidase family FAD-binding enzyme [Methanocorpusculum sp.]